MSTTLIEAARRHSAKCADAAQALIDQGPMTFNRVAERLITARAERTGDLTNIVAMTMRGIRDADLHATQQEARDIVLEELAEAQRRIGARLLASAQRRAQAGGPFPIEENAA